jgi:hypothetical protein
VSTNIFLSVGSALTSEQRQFVEAVEALLSAHDLVPRTVGRTDFADRQPLKRVAEVMRECSGTLVLALKRIQISEGSELCEPPFTTQLAGVSLPTVWNQIEAAMAYSMGQPLLAIVESGLRNEGVLEDGYDWYTKWVDLSPGSVAEPEFLRTFAAWKQNILRYKAEPSGRESISRPEGALVRRASQHVSFT